MRVLVCAVLLAAACGDNVSGDGDGGSGGPDAGSISGLLSISIEPGDATLTIDGDVAVSQVYVARGTFEGGRTEDVTTRVSWSVGDSRLGRFQGATFTSGIDRGGVAAVRASAGAINGTATLTLLLRKRIAVGIPMPDPAFFTRPEDEGRAPDLVYPNDGVLLPPNLRRMELHFLAGAGNDVFELSFSNATTDVRVYTSCTTLGAGCLYEPALAVWMWIAETNRGRGPLTVTVRGTSAAAATLGISTAQTVSFSKDDLSGAIYYWTTTDETAIMRYDFGDETQDEAELYLDTTMTEGTCLGCHALSRDGSKMVTATGGSYDARVLLLDVATSLPLAGYGAPPRSAFSSWDPDGTRYVGVYGGDTDVINHDLLLLNGDTGAHEGTIDVGGTAESPADHPDWSPDGTQIAFVRAKVGQLPTLVRFHQGSIELVDQDGAGWTEPEVIVPSTVGTNVFYPTFSPDGALLIFNRSVCPGGTEDADCDSYNDQVARLWMVTAAPGSTPVELAKANAPGELDEETDLTSSFPKWSPFIFERDAEVGSRLEWVTFASTRAYGLRGVPANAGTLVWMSGVDPDLALSGTDPSTPAFVLPYQDLTTSNHTAQWTTRIVVVE
jgi:Tol biopolymer transport system component